MTTDTQLLIYQHENTHPVATSSLVYQELAKRAKELERELAKKDELIAQMEKGFIIESRTHEH